MASLYGDDLYGNGLYGDSLEADDYGFGDYGDYGYGAQIDPYTYGYGGYGDESYDDYVPNSIYVTTTTSLCSLRLRSVTGSAKLLLTTIRVPQPANPIVQSSPTIMSPTISSK